VATAITGQAPAIPSGAVVTIVNSVARTNQRPNPPVSANGKYLENVVQITRESYGVGEHLTQGGGVTLRSAGTSSTGNRTLALRGFATIVCVASNEFVINGGGLS
jgi:hypothetical protein